MADIVKITGSLFVVAFFVGLFLVDNREWRDFGTKMMALTGVIFVLSVIWSFP